MYDLQPQVVLIDDDRDDLELLSSILEQKDVGVKTFESPKTALIYLEYLAENDKLPSLIIMDYNMPLQNGYQVLLSIKGNTNTKEIPVVIQSTNMSNDLEKRLSDAGAFCCFSKPWTYQQLATQVEIFQQLCTSFAKKPARY